jgi:hypothetical protein
MNPGQEVCSILDLLCMAKAWRDERLSTLTPEGRKTLHAHPDRVDAVNDEVAAFGCKVVAQYAVLGQYDFLTLIDAPTCEDVGAGPGSPTCPRHGAEGLQGIDR